VLNRSDEISGVIVISKRILYFLTYFKYMNIF